MTNKEKYRMLCEVNKTITLFQSAWWLDSVCGDNWDVCLIEKDSKVVAALPYYVKKKYGLTLLTHPDLTQHLGPWFEPRNCKYSKYLSQQKGYMNDLIKQLPEFSYMNHNWNHELKNWLPFYWLGFDQTTRYTYIIEDLSEQKKIWDAFESNIRGDIRKAEKNNLEVYTDCSIDDFMELNNKVFKRQGLELPYSEEFVKELVSVAKKRNQCRWFIAQDQNLQKHAGVLIVWDEKSAYYIMGGGDPDLRNSGATSLCMWEAIKFASTVTSMFDFEGSMIEPVEKFFRAFGAVQKPYFAVSKVTSPILELGLSLKKTVNKIIK